MIPVNPASAVRPPRIERAEPTIPDPEQVSAILQAAGGRGELGREHLRASRAGHARIDRGHGRPSVALWPAGHDHGPIRGRDPAGAAGAGERLQEMRTHGISLTDKALGRLPMRRESDTTQTKMTGQTS